MQNLPFPSKSNICVCVRKPHHEKPLAPAPTASSKYSGQHQHTRLTIIHILTPAYSMYMCTSIPLPGPSINQVTNLPAVFIWNSPRDCGSCRQPLLSASLLIYRHTHVKMLFTAKPDVWRGWAAEGKEIRNWTEAEVPYGLKKLERHKRCAGRKMPSTKGYR